MTTVRWKLYEEVKEQFPEQQVHLTYGAETKERRRSRSIAKSHINDAYVMGQFHPKHRTGQVLWTKRRRNNRCLEKFYDAKYIDGWTGKKAGGKDLTNGRISRNHDKDSENLHLCRKQKLSAGKRVIRKRRYPIQPHDIVLYEGKRYETAGCHCHGTRVILLPDKRSVAIKKLTVCYHAGGYYEQPLRKEESRME